VKNIIDACGVHGKTERILLILKEMKGIFDLEPNKVIFSSAIVAFSRNGKLKEVIQTIHLMEDEDFTLDLKDGKYILQLMAEESIPTRFEQIWSELKDGLGTGNFKLNLKSFRKTLGKIEKILDFYE
jgi:pentatricopeptide repeat protein